MTEIRFCVVAVVLGLVPLLSFGQSDIDGQALFKTSKETINRTVEDGGTGPLKALMGSDESLPTHTVFRPKDLSHGTNNVRLPIVAWGNGACANSPWELLRWIASA